MGVEQAGQAGSHRGPERGSSQDSPSSLRFDPPGRGAPRGTLAEKNLLADSRGRLHPRSGGPARDGVGARPGGQFTSVQPGARAGIATRPLGSTSIPRASRACSGDAQQQARRRSETALARLARDKYHAILQRPLGPRVLGPRKTRKCFNLPERLVTCWLTKPRDTQVTIFTTLAIQLRTLRNKKAPEEVLMTASFAVGKRALTLFNKHAAAGAPGFIELSSWAMVRRLYLAVKPECFFAPEYLREGWGYGDGNWWMLADDTACLLEALAQEIGENKDAEHPAPAVLSKTVPTLSKRCEELLRLLSGPVRMDQVDLAAELDVHRTTVGRDLAILRDLGLVLVLSRRDIRITEAGRSWLNAANLHGCDRTTANLLS